MYIKVKRKWEKQNKIKLEVEKLKSQRQEIQIKIPSKQKAEGTVHHLKQDGREDQYLILLTCNIK